MRLISNLLFRYELWKKRRLTERELYSLSDHELNDLGINRGDIPRIVRESTLTLKRTDRWVKEVKEMLEDEST